MASMFLRFREDIEGTKLSNLICRRKQPSWPPEISNFRYEVLVLVILCSLADQTSLALRHGL